MPNSRSFGVKNATEGIISSTKNESQMKYLTEVGQRCFWFQLWWQYNEGQGFVPADRGAHEVGIA